MENRTDQRVFWHGKLKKESRKTWQATALTALCSVALFCLLFSYKKIVSLRGWISGDHGFIFPVSAAFVSFL